jgi:hypothetical protein
VLTESKGKGTAVWHMARMMKVYSGKDGCVEAVRLKMEAGE